LRRHALPQGHRAAQGRAGGVVTNPIRVGIVLGSDSDLEVMLEAVKVLDLLEVGSEVVVASAHRTPKKTEEYASTAEARGLGVLIAAAGGAAAQVLRRGGLVAFPTETFYGLGAAALDRAAVRRVFEVKGRPASMPLLVLIDAPARLRDVVDDIPPRAQPLIDRHWPGPLTLVFRAAAHVPSELTAGTGTVGVRVPSHRVPRALVTQLDGA